ncbi:zinc-dependent alcohol dehydrogenase [Ningiella sp. W23]|uniref:zinc-dependent alcohol dehydrogenase n=1 Tax=Ningiella sp. W23 TaxID=3023715 RepID=UPI00375830D5
MNQTLPEHDTHIDNLSVWHTDNETTLLMPQQGSSEYSSKLRVSSRFSMISSGTEKMVALGKVPLALEKHMQVPYMQGSFKLPIKYGYSLVGATPSGDLVHVLHPHQQYAYVDKSSTFSLPKHLPARRMTLISNMETIINALWDSESALDDADTIAVCGFGNIGALLALTLQNKGYDKVCVIENDPWRRVKANELGFDAFSSSSHSSKYDLLYHTSSTQAGLQWCIDNTRLESKIVELSWHLGGKLTLDLSKHFHYNRLNIISSQVSSIPKSKADESYESRKKLALTLLEDAKYDQLFAPNVALTDAPAFFKALRNAQLSEGLIWCIEYP